MSSIADIVSRREISEIVHFTTNKGLVGIFGVGAVLSRERLKKEDYLEYVYHPNASTRKDEDWLGHVNLSISKINTKYFDHSTRTHAHTDVWWCALAFDPEMLSHEGVFFATTNNIYSRCRRAEGPAGLEALFAERIERWRGNRVTREDQMPDNLPTCYQAEVLYPRELMLDGLLKVYVARGHHADIVASARDILLVPGESGPAHEIPIVIDPDAFEP
ncbi:MAG TPA: DarT ssDNA thymidine ADP-ribosyltransferase family protein [Solirubrobacterales bacterium]|nr:DarT ssDNA thymidine ADP-ribosyltransferase family protein [Solirubrobacterales bacterium]